MSNEIYQNKENTAYVFLQNYVTEQRVQSNDRVSLVPKPNLCLAAVSAPIVLDSAKEKDTVHIRHDESLFL